MFLFSNKFVFCAIHFSEAMHKALQKKYTGQNRDDPDGFSESQHSNPNFHSENTYPSYAINGTTSQTTYSTSKTSETVFSSNSKGSQLIDEIVKRLEQYNCPKSGVRFTSDCFPDTRQSFKESKFPIAAIIQPYASVYPSESFPTVSFGSTKEPVRCSSCKAYINPFNDFIADGSKFRCNFCNALNDVPDYYFAPLDHNGERVDKYERAELCCGTYDFKAGTDYMNRPPIPPTFVFLIDVSQEAVLTGMLEIATKVLQELVENDAFPGEGRAQIGIMTYDSALHYFVINPKLKYPKIVTVTNPKEFGDSTPFPDDLLVNIADYKGAVLSTISALPKVFSNTKERGSCLLAALNCITKNIKHVGGRLFVVQASSTLTTERGFNLTQPVQSIDKREFYAPVHEEPSILSKEMHRYCISTTFFIFSKAYKNIITVGELSRYTAGEIFYYASRADRQQKFYHEFKNVIMKDTVWEAVYRLRVSAGWKIVKRYGNYGIKGGDLLAVPSIDENFSFVYEFELESEPKQKPSVFYIQSVLLFTNAKGEKRIRVINYGVPTGSMQDVYLKADSQAVGLTMFRKALVKLYETQDPVAARESLIKDTHDIVQEMYKVCGSSIKHGSFIDSLATLPLTILGMVKSSILSPNGVTASKDMDVRNAMRFRLNSTSLDDAMLFFTPYLFALHTLVDENAGVYDEEGCFVFPSLLSLASANLSKSGLYLLDDGLGLYMLVGSQISKEILNNLFGVADLSELPKLMEENMYSNPKDPLVERIYNLIMELRSRKTEKYAFLHIIKEGEKSAAEFEFYLKLIEDKTIHPHTLSISYSEFVNRLLQKHQK